MPDAESNVAAAHSARLRYVTDESRGLSRQRRGKSFIYFCPNGKLLRDPQVKDRIHSLVIPPAWTDVWICPYANGHIQATGRDAAGRKQHRYHERWRTSRDGAKYEHVISFAKKLPVIRRRTSADLRRPGLPREKVLALAVQLLEKTLIRVGNDEYAQQHQHFGLTTLRDRHVRVTGGQAVFEFTGKSGVHRQVKLRDGHLAKLIQDCQELPGQHLFRYRDEAGKLHNINSTDVNAYLHEIAGDGFTAKDFRTWAGTVLAARALHALGECPSKAAKKNIVSAIETVSKQLGNTPSICRKCYVHPAILNSYVDGSLIRTFQQRSTALGRRSGLSAERAVVLHLLKSACHSRAKPIS